MKYKIEIIEKNKKFLDEIFDFLLKKSFEFKRNYKIDTTLNKKIDKSEYLKKSSPINVESVYGSTFQSKYRSDDQIYAISHSIHSIEISNDKILANITSNEYGEIIDFDKGHLKPVYYKDDKNEYCLATFDVDFNINN
jgi:hypothetical protein